MPASQLSTGLSLSVLSRETAEALRTFAVFLGKGGKTAEAPLRPSLTKGPNEGPRGIRRFRGRAAQATHGVGSRSEHVESRDENAGLVGRDGRVFYRSTEATNHPHVVSVRSRSWVRCTARREARRSRRCRRRLGPASTSGRCTALLCSRATERRRTGRDPRMAHGMSAHDN